MTTDNRSLDLLVQEVTEGLDAAGTMELRQRLGADLDDELSAFAFAAAASELAMGGLDHEMPRAVRDKARQAYLDAASNESTTDSVPTLRHRPRQRTPAPSARFGDRLGWLIAAAALLLAVIGWWPRPGDWPLPETTRRAEPEVRRSQLLANAGDAVELPWQATGDPAATGAAGDVVWSHDRQVGFMRFRGLAVNDPSDHQYQLWIFDGSRDDRFPVDGGVFDIDGSGEIIVPIRAKLEVEAPVLFAVTIERPGGVVVSSRERIVLMAKVG